MKRRGVLSLMIATAVVASCGQVPQGASVPSDDQAVVALVLEDFAHWKEATFGQLEGVLIVDTETLVASDEVRAIAPTLVNEIEDELVVAQMRRNGASTPVKDLVTSSAWVRLGQARTGPDYRRALLPEDAKAFVSLTLPGFNAAGTKGLLLLYHSWSMHHAVVTYVLSKQRGEWRILGREQRVFI